MSAKRVAFTAKPQPKASRQNARDAWVEDQGEREPMARLTIDIPRSLHNEIKSACALRGAKMVDEIRALLLREYRKA